MVFIEVNITSQIYDAENGSIAFIVSLEIFGYSLSKMR